MTLSDIAEDRERWWELVVESVAESSWMMKTSSDLTSQKPLALYNKTCLEQDDV